MPVMELSTITSVIWPLLYTASTRPVIPEWTNVESPIRPMVLRDCSVPRAFSMPRAMPTDAPMHTTEWMELSGATAPSV